MFAMYYEFALFETLQVATIIVTLKLFHYSNPFHSRIMSQQRQQQQEYETQLANQNMRILIEDMENLMRKSYPWDKPNLLRDVVAQADKLLNRADELTSKHVFCCDTISAIQEKKKKLKISHILG